MTNKIVANKEGDNDIGTVLGNGCSKSSGISSLLRSSQLSGAAFFVCKTFERRSAPHHKVVMPIAKQVKNSDQLKW